MAAIRAVSIALVGAFLLGGGSLVAPHPVAAATTFTVNKIGDAADSNLADSKCDTSTKSGNQCTLRAAIQEANDTAGVDTINFNITSTSKTITPGSPLPPITQPVTINGYSQSGASANTKATGNDAVLKIVIDGINAGDGVGGLELLGSDTTIRGLVIQRFDDYGLRVGGGGDHLIAGNFIGTNAAGNAARANTVGIYVTSRGNTIGGPTPGARNLISGNSAYGMRIEGADAEENLVQGNYIGTTKAGTAALGNGDTGVILLDGTDNTIGGTTAGERNVVSANGGDGIKLLNVDVDNVVSGNYVGTNAAGTAALGNSYYGIAVEDSAPATIGGSVAGAGNVVSASRYAGIELVRGEGSIVQGNRVGTKADGSGDLGNGRHGIFVFSPNAIVGGAGAAANLISGNVDDGIYVQYSTYTGIQITGNVIRLNDANGVRVICNDVTIGGNVIYQNGEDGVYVDLNAKRARVTGNQLFGNGQLGIDLEGGTENSYGVTSNDTDDPDTGANNRQNFPVLTSATRSSQTGVTIVSGSLNSNPSTEFRIELFMAVADASGHGEGQVLLATTDVTTNPGGDTGFSFTSTWPLGLTLTAVAINKSTGDTSEFSANRVITP